MIFENFDFENSLTNAAKVLETFFKVESVSNKKKDFINISSVEFQNDIQIREVKCLLKSITFENRFDTFEFTDRDFENIVVRRAGISLYPILSKDELNILLMFMLDEKYLKGQRRLY